MNYKISSPHAKNVTEENSTFSSQNTNNQLSETDRLLKLLLTRMTKWKLAKRMEVTWQTVHCWSKGVFIPSKEKTNKLRLIEEETRGQA